LVSKLKRAEKVQQSVNLFLKSVDSCLRLVLSPTPVYVAMLYITSLKNYTQRSTCIQMMLLW